MGCVIRPYFVPYTWPVYAGLDMGPIHTAGVLAAMNEREQSLDVFATYLQDANLRNRVRDEMGSELVSLRDAEDTERLLMCQVHVAELRRRTQSANVGSVEQRVRKIRRAWGGVASEGKWRSDFRRAGLVVSYSGTDDKELKIKWLDGSFLVERVRVFDTCEALRGEIEEYQRELDDDGEVTEKILDPHKFHRLDALIELNAGVFPGEQGKSGFRRRSLIKTQRRRGDDEIDD